MKKFLILIFQVIFIIITLSGCSLIKPLEFKHINSFKLEENKNTRGIKVKTNFTLKNPNNFTFTINAADIDVIAEGVNLGKLQIPNEIVINKKSDFTGDFFVEISFTQLLLAGKNVLAKIKSGSIVVEFKGHIDSKALGFQKNFEVNHKEKIDIRI